MADTERRLDYRDPDWLAEQLGVDKSTIYRYLQDGTLPGLQLGRKWLVSERQVVEFLDTEARRQADARRRAGQTSGLFHFERRRMRFDKFTERARRALTAAQEEAFGLRHNYIGTEHMLLGVLKIRDSVAAFSLRNLGVEFENVRQSVVKIVGEGKEDVPGGEIGLTPRAKKVLELAVAEAKGLRHNYIGTEHLLLGLLREGEGIAAGILHQLDVGLAEARREILRLLATGSSPEHWETASKTADADPTDSDGRFV